MFGKPLGITNPSAFRRVPATVDPFSKKRYADMAERGRHPVWAALRADEAGVAVHHDACEMEIEELLTELTMLQTRLNSSEGLLPAEGERLREVKAALGDGFCRISAREERRRDLRLQVSVNLVIRLDGRSTEVRCWDFSKGGLFLEMATPAQTGTEIQIESIELAGRTAVLNVAAIVVWRNSDPTEGPNALPVGVGLQFMDVDRATRDRLDAAFECLLDTASTHSLPESEEPARPSAMKIRDESQLFRVCRAVLRRAGLDRLWSDDGPSEQAKDLLRENGRPLAEDKRTLLLFVWRLWNGSCDLRATQLWRLDSEMQDVLVNLVIALGHGFDAVDDWLAAECASNRASVGEDV